MLNGKQTNKQPNSLELLPLNFKEIATKTLLKFQ